MYIDVLEQVNEENEATLGKKLKEKVDNESVSLPLNTIEVTKKKKKKEKSNVDKTTKDQGIGVVVFVFNGYRRYRAV